MDIRGSRILVTGAAGLLGSHIVDQLVEENEAAEIIALDRNVGDFVRYRSPRLDYGKVKLVTGDITKVEDVRQALQGVDSVIHTAAVLTREAAGDLRIGMEVIANGTFNLLEEGVRAGVKKFIYSSTVSVYGDVVTLPATEEHPLLADSIYGATKVCGEMLLRVFKKVHGLDYVALRYAQIYGPRQHYRANLILFVPETFDRIEQGLPPLIYGDGSHFYDYVFVEDVARANLLGLKSDVTGEAFNVGTGISTSVKDVVRVIMEITGAKTEPQHVPQGSRFRIQSNAFDVSKAQRMLGFQAQVPLREGLRRYYEWRRES